MPITLIHPFMNAYPEITGTAMDTDNVAGTSHVFTLPTGIVDGELLLLNAAFDRGTSTPNPVTPAGWTKLGGHSDYDSNDAVHEIYYKTASSESGTVTVTTSLDCRSVAGSYRIARANQTPEIGTFFPGNDTAPNPLSLTASQESNNLWIAIMASTEEPVTVYPTNYSLGQITGESTVGNDDPAVGMAARNVFSATQDPGAFTIATTARWSAVTVVVLPTV